jgi:hypothetical protein
MFDCFQVKDCVLIQNESQPLYKRGNRDLIAINIMNLVLYALTFLFYRGINQYRDKIWNSWSPKVRIKTSIHRCRLIVAFSNARNMSRPRKMKETSEWTSDMHTE